MKRARLSDHNHLNLLSIHPDALRKLLGYLELNELGLYQLVCKDLQKTIVKVISSLRNVAVVSEGEAMMLKKYCRKLTHFEADFLNGENYTYEWSSLLLNNKHLTHVKIPESVHLFDALICSELSLTSFGSSYKFVLPPIPLIGPTLTSLYLYFGSTRRMALLLDVADHCPNLTSLEFGTRVFYVSENVGQVFAKLGQQCRKLTKLILCATFFSAAVLAQFAHLRNLTSLTLFRSGTMAEIARFLPNLRELVMRSARDINDDLYEVNYHCTNLTTLALPDFAYVPHETLSRLFQTLNLRNLSLSTYQFKQFVKENDKTALVSLEELNLAAFHFGGFLTLQDSAHVKKFAPNLKSLTISRAESMHVVEFLKREFNLYCICY